MQYNFTGTWSSGTDKLMFFDRGGDQYDVLLNGVNKGKVFILNNSPQSATLMAEKDFYTTLGVPLPEEEVRKHFQITEFPLNINLKNENTFVLGSTVFNRVQE